MRHALPLALFAVGCSSQAEPSAWITLDRDALATARTVIGTDAIAHEISDGVVAISVDPDKLPALSQTMHAQHHRCSGFAVHDDFDGAAAIAAPNAQGFAPSYTIDNADAVHALLPLVQQANIVTVMQQISAAPTRFYTSSTGVQAAVALRDRWAAYAPNRADITVELFTHPSWPQKSVIATIAGTSSETLVIGAHLDSITQVGGNAPGADDDASGIAVESEVLRTLAASGYKPQRTIKIIGYAAEEVGLRGSQEIVASFQQQGVNVVGVMQLDMTDFKGSSRDVYLMQDFTNATLNTFVGNLIDTYVTGATWGTDQCGYACSDHASWSRKGFAATMPAEATYADTNPVLHTPDDTVANADATGGHAFVFAKLATAYVAELAKGGIAKPNMDPELAIARATPTELAGTATDNEDGDLAAAIVWSSDKDGMLGTGATLAVHLSRGTHVITARVQDSTQAMATATAMVVVGGGGGGGDDDDGGGSSGCSTGTSTSFGACLVLALIGAVRAGRGKRAARACRR